ncbi:CcmD family protein [Adhaeribacter aquaticus]|uniref:CcmD family protein n=1 Tax=Adhaeribacter aquaticus TaxID=299567 RepID=UPI000688EC4B|nr:hypothetical protein [Adhaeribacter aquaticus]
MKMFKKWALLVCLLLSLLVANVSVAQSESTVMVEANAGAQEVEMADKLRSDGKIYVVVGCVLVVLVGMIIYLVAIDKKISRLEKQYKS